MSIELKEKVISDVRVVTSVDDGLREQVRVAVKTNL